MSTNSNLQQINVFNNGMNTDTSDAYLSSDLYRYAENLRFITDTGENSGELRSIEGYFEDNTISEIFADEDIIAATSIRLYIIVLSNDYNADLAYVHVYDYLNNTSETPYINTRDLWRTDIKYSLVTRWESDDNIKLYIADGVHELMSLNIKKGVDNSSFDTLSNNIAIPKISASIILEPGQIKSPVIQYYYYLYNVGGNRSDLSVGSNVLRLYKDDMSGYDYEESTNRSAEVTIYYLPNIGYQRIRVYRLEYTRSGSPAKVYLVCDEEIPMSQPFSYKDYGAHVYEESLSEFLSNVKYRIVPTYIESKGDHLFAANIKDVQNSVDKLFEDFSYDSGNVEIITLTYKVNKLNKIYSNDINKYGPSLMRGEKYRYGIVFYMHSGRKSSVFHLCDYTIPEDRRFVEIENDNGTVSYSFTRYGLKFNNIQIPRKASSGEDYCVGYEIVRCDRTIDDSRIISQGVLGATFGKDDLRYASNLMTMLILYKTCEFLSIAGELDVSDDFTNTSYADVVMFASPEVVYLHDDLENAIDNYKDSIFLQLSNIYTITNTNSGVPLPDGVIKYIDYDYDPDGDDLLTKDGFIYSLYVHDRYNGLSGASLFFEYEEKNIYIEPNFIYPHAQYSGNISKRLDKIDETKYIDSPSAYDFNNGDTVTIDKNTATISNKQFVNWDAHPFLYTGEINTDPTMSMYIPMSGMHEFNVKVYMLNTGDSWEDDMPMSVSTGKRCLLINSPSLELLSGQNGSYGGAPISVYNIVRDGVVPYGGDSEAIKSTNVYYSHGDYKAYDKTSNDNSISVWSGDVFSSLFIYNSSHTYCSDRFYGISHPTIYAIPVESKIDLIGVSGDILSKNQYTYRDLLCQDTAGKYFNMVLQKDAYMYNTVYSDKAATMSYTPRYLDTLMNLNTDTRVHYSDVKTNGELIDNWLNFKAMNFLDVDSRYGEITGLRLFKNSLVYWQKNATGILSSGERTILLDVNDTNIILGNSDVLQRFDYLSLKYGMTKNQLCDTQSDNTLYWWDEDSKDLITYSGGLTVYPMKISKTVSNLINSSTIVNPTLAYDNKYKEIIFSNIICNSGLSPKSLAYNELVLLFTSIYNVNFQNKLELGDKLLLINENVDDQYHIIEWNRNGGGLTPQLKYIINDKNMYTKVYDNVLIGMGESFFNQDEGRYYSEEYCQNQKIDENELVFNFYTKNQHSVCNDGITLREYDLRLAIPRDENAKYGNRMRGRTMQCELTSSSTEFSLQYIITKYRISWS